MWLLVLHCYCKSIIMLCNILSLQDYVYMYYIHYSYSISKLITALFGSATVPAVLLLPRCAGDHGPPPPTEDARLTVPSRWKTRQISNIHHLHWNRLSNGLNGTEAGWTQPILTSLQPDSRQYLNVIVHHNTMFFIILCCLLPGNKMFYSILFYNLGIAPW